MGLRDLLNEDNGAGGGARRLRLGPAPKFPAGNLTFNLPCGTKLTLIHVKAGTFMMGSPEDELGRYCGEKQHQVTLTRDYWLGQFPVTQGQWQAVMGNNPASFKKGDDYPVETVSWDDAQAFCAKLNERYRGQLPDGYGFDLPTEAQWEYACRAGTTTALNNGKSLTSENGVCPNLNEVGWYDENSDGATRPVGQKEANAWGLFDMHGNVWEWCRDWYGDYPSGAVTDPPGPLAGQCRVNRGGSWNDGAWNCRAAWRVGDAPGSRFYDVGFRLALVPVQ